MADVPPSLGARLWDDAMQGSDHTTPPGQVPLIPGGPEGVVFGRAGTLCVNETGALYKKGTDVSLKTGWVAITVP